VAAAVAKVAHGHKNSKIHICCGNCQRANACSVLEILTLGVANGSLLEIVADGPDEEAVIEKLRGLFENGGGI
jgi:phosphotransferase system HPr (HPr) family protein